jgi:hypothetical protein
MVKAKGSMNIETYDKEKVGGTDSMETEKGQIDIWNR